jgi:hypothetical protein
MSITGFSIEVQKQLGYYVYRLIDPRNGNTFYVGKGKGSRVFAHIQGALKNDGALDEEDDEDLKTSTILEIRNAGLEVLHVIHRHGMDNDTALEVEAALIDAYPGLVNKISGKGADFGVMNAREIEALYGSKTVDFGGDKCVIIKTRQSRVDDFGYYDSVRFAWVANPERLNGADYVICAVNGIVKKVYRTDGPWKAIEPGKITPGFERFGAADIDGRIRYGFTGGEVTDPHITARYVNRALPQDMRRRGMANPVLYNW